MSSDSFRRELERRNPDPAGRRWLFIPYDQTTDAIGPLGRRDPAATGIVVVESLWKPSLRPYHKQKLALILSNLRHFALEQAARGVAVRHVVTPGSYGDALRPEAARLGGLTVMRPAERELRVDLAPLVADGLLEVVPHEGWLTTEAQFAASQRSEPPWRMDAFYRQVRRDTGILMDGDRPEGGKYSFDAHNREPWPGEPPAPDLPALPLDPVKSEVLELVEARFPDHPGELDGDGLTATREDAEAVWRWALEECLPRFGPYEDAMSASSESLFHTRISFLLHVHRLLPSRVVEDVAAADIDLGSREGFIRQVLGWREFMRHVHERTDGFRSLPGAASDPEAAAEPNALGAARPLPPAFWGTRSGLACLDTVVDRVVRTGYSHHITRLMVLSNISTLLDVSPRELTDWFWAMYTDAFDWVVEPNVLGMGTFAAGDLMTTKPYVSGAAYINRMSDYCSTCRFDPRKDCPITPLYWAFLDRKREQLAGNPRMRLPLASLGKRPAERREADRREFERVSAALAAGEALG